MSIIATLIWAGGADIAYLHARKTHGGLVSLWKGFFWPMYLGEWIARKIYA